jgi:Glycosyl hydrolase family 76
MTLACACTAVSRAHADTPAGSDVRTRLAGEVQHGIEAVNERWGWKGWYRDRPDVTSWSSIWDTVQLFEAYAGIEAASPTPLHRRMLVEFAVKSERYANPRLGGGIGGYSTGYALRGEQGTMWFDDNGWLGLAFFDAYRQTHMARFLSDAKKAFRFMYQVGWDPAAGGIWWNSQHTLKCAESENTAALLAVELYEAHAGTGYLRAAHQILDWSDAHLFNARTGLYDNHPSMGVAISYNQSPMLDALVRLCRDGQGYCDRVAPLRTATLSTFGAALHQAPQYDAMYLRYLIDVSSITHDPAGYEVAYANAERIEANALDADGYYLRAWDGSMDAIAPGLISVNGAALEALAWTAAIAPPT